MNVVAIIGLSGVGKSTFLKSVQNSLDFKHLEASQLLKDEFAHRAKFAPSSEELRLGEVLDNQGMLVAAFRRQTEGYEGTVFFDGHILIDGKEGIVEIPPSVFADLGVSKFVFLQALPDAIASRRAIDVGRVRPSRTAAEIEQHQGKAIQLLATAGLQLGAPMLVISNEQVTTFINFVIGR